MIFIIIFITFSIKSFGQLPTDIKNECEKYDKQIQEALQQNNFSEAASLLSKVGYLLVSKNYKREAIPYYEQLLNINQQIGNKRGVLNTYNTIGMLYFEIDEYEKCITNLQKSLQMMKQMGSSVEDQIATLTNISLAYQSLKKYNESNRIIEEAVDLAKNINDLKLLRRCYGILYENYEKLGDHDKSYKYFELYSSIDKEIKKREMQQVKEEAQMVVSKVEAEKKLTEEELKNKQQALLKTTDALKKVEKLTREQQLEIEVKNAQLREKDALLRLKNLRIKTITIGLFIVICFSIILTLLTIRLRIANQKIKYQRDLLDLQNKNITSSIRYAMTIQQAMLPDFSVLKDIFESFIIYRPKDIVSGDFYWFSFVNGFNKDKLLVAVVDCTGHGVPGAFMSMIGNRLLNEIVHERKIFNPCDILENLNKEVRKALRQDETDNNDGMDVSIAYFEKQNENMKMIFAGARRNAYIIRNSNGELINLKGEKKSIGGYGENKENITFTNHELILNKGDLIYMLTDGIIDQNNAERIRYGSKRLESILTNIHKLSLEDQKAFLENDLLNYMNGEEQRDDITILGLKVKL